MSRLTNDEMRDMHGAAFDAFMVNPVNVHLFGLLLAMGSPEISDLRRVLEVAFAAGEGSGFDMVREQQRRMK